MIEIDKVLSDGEVGNGKTWKTSDDMLDDVGRVMEKNYTNDILGDVRFVGKDGKTYIVELQAVIVEADEDEAEGDDNLTPDQGLELKGLVASQNPAFAQVIEDMSDEFPMLDSNIVKGVLIDLVEMPKSGNFDTDVLTLRGQVEKLMAFDREHELSEGGCLEAPELDSGAIRRRDLDGSTMEVRNMDDEDYFEWLKLFLKK